MMNIDGIGEEMVNDLCEKGYLKDCADIYDLTADQIKSLYVKGDRIAEKILKSIEASKSMPYERVLYALSIPYVGETGAKKIARASGNIDRLMSMTEEELTAIDDVGPNIARRHNRFFCR